MLEVKLDQDLNKYTVAPMEFTDKNNYVIVCKSEYEAKSLCAQIMMGMIKSPADEPLKYSNIGNHPDGKRALYSF